MRTIVITGASDGIGAAAASQLADTNARLVLVGRSPEKTRRVADTVGAEHHVADFTRLEEVRALASALRASCERIDVLANNAGGMFSGPMATADGFERTFQINHLAPYLLTHLLLDRLLESRAAVVATSSIGARLFGRIDLNDLNDWDRFSPSRAYGDAKLANILFTRALHERFHDRGLSAVAFHPGTVATNFASESETWFQHVYHGVLQRFLVSPAEGGARLRHFIDHRQEWRSGEYYRAPGRIGRTNRQAYNDAMVAGHWRRSADMLGIQW